MTLPVDLPWRSRWVYGPSGGQISWTQLVSAAPFIPRRGGVGGSRTAASGVPAGYVVRKDHLFDLPTRFLESERAAFDAMLDWSDIGEEITWYPDASDTGWSYQVYIEAPKAGDEFVPARDAKYGRLYTVTMTLRFVAATLPSFDYYAFNP